MILSMQVYTYCKVGVRPLPAWVAAGVAAGVAGVTPVPFAAWPPCAPLVIRVLSKGGVSSAAADGKEREPGAVNALACAALTGWV